MERKAPASLSVYRGQSRRGIGEGPGKPIAHGEQYLAASQSLVDGELLDGIRHWMTLDSDPADHQRLQDRLESWSCFGIRNFRFVVRLTPAGIYDRRAAYFAHGRAWPLDKLEPGCDPGLHIGRSGAFEQPWRDDDQGARVAKEPFPELAKPQQVADEASTAARFLAHLYQCCLRSRPLIIAVPVSAFEAGSALHALVSFARGALPRDLRDRCDVRIYTRTPDLFLGQLKARLVVVPEDVAGNALGVRRDASLLDREGKTLAGGAPEPAALAYAEAVVERAIKIPEGLPLFSRRFQERRAGSGLPDAEDVRMIQVTYNLAVALADTPDEQRSFVRDYLPRVAQKLGSSLSWGRLIEPTEWSAFPRDAVLELILRDCSGEQLAHLRELQRSTEEAAVRLGWRLDADLATWWNAGDDQKLKRLLSLFQASPLISEATVAERTSEVALHRVEAIDSSVIPRVLAAELAHKHLSRRAKEAEELGELAARPEVFEILRQAVEQRVLDPRWAKAGLARAQGEPLLERAKRFLQVEQFFEAEDLWGEVPGLLLGALDRVGQIPPVLAALIVRVGKTLDPASQLPTWLRLTDLLAPAGDQGPLDELIAQLDESTLVRLVQRPPEPATLQKVFHLLDRRMSREPARTTEDLVRAGWWYAWRWASGLDKPQLVTAAIAWMNVPWWSDREATREAWQMALSDLPQDLSEEQMGRVCGGGHRPWPWIPPFEEDQVGELIARAGNLGALARLAVALRGDAFLFPGGSSHRYVLSRSAFASRLPEGALAWLTDPACSSPVLTLQQSRFLHQRAGGLGEGALRARIFSIADCLRHSQAEEALREAGDAQLWGNGDFLALLASWMCNDGILARKLAAGINAHIDGIPTEYPQRPPQALLAELEERGLDRVVALLRAPQGAALQASPAKGASQPLSEEILCALGAARETDPCWAELARKLAPGREELVQGHPLSEAASKIRHAGRGRLGYAAWRTFEGASAQRGVLLRHQTGSSSGLPAFELAASLLEEGSLGNAALLVIFAKGSSGHRREIGWWRALLRSLRDWSRRDGIQSAHDRSDTAVALIVSSLDELESTEKEAFWHAFTKEAEDPTWELPAEFGVIPHEQSDVLSRPATEGGGGVHDQSEGSRAELPGVRVLQKAAQPGKPAKSPGRGSGGGKRDSKRGSGGPRARK